LSHQKVLWLLLAGFVALTFALSVLNPIWEAPDEPAHFQYVQLLAQRHQLPTLNEDLPGLTAADRQELHQPPLFYLLAAPLVLPVNLNSNPSWLLNPYFTWPNHPLRNGIAVHMVAEQWPFHGQVLGVHLMRLTSVLLGAATVLVVYLIAVHIGLGSAFALLGASIAALTPAFFISSSAIDNDNAAILCSSVTLLSALVTLRQKRRQWLGFASFGACTGLALLSKNDALFLLPVGALLAAVVAIRDCLGLSSWYAVKRAALHVLVMSAVCGLVAGWYYRGPLWPSGALVAQSVQRAIETAPNYVSSAPPAHAQTASWRDMASFAQHLFKTYYGSFSWDMFYPPQPFYWLFSGLATLAGAGLILRLARAVRQGRWSALLLEDRCASVVLLTASLGASMFLVTARFLVAAHDHPGAAGGLDHARFILPALAGSCVLFALGFGGLPGWLGRAGAATLLAGGAGVAAFALWAVPRSFGPAVRLYDTAQQMAIQHPEALVTQNGLQLVGWSNANDPVLPGGTAHLQLFWQPETPVNWGNNIALQLDDGKGPPIAAADHDLLVVSDVTPQMWLPGEVIADDWSISVPATARPGQYRIDLSLYQGDSRPSGTLPYVQLSAPVVIGSGSP